MIKGRAFLVLFDAALDATIEKVDKENEKWIGETDFPDEQKETIVSAMNEFERQLTDFFVTQQKQILAVIRRSVKKANEEFDPQPLLDALLKYFDENDEQYLLQLKAIYGAAFEPMIDRIAAAACAELNKAKEIKSRSEQISAWLDNHRTKFAGSVSDTSRKAVIETVRRSESVDDTIQRLVDLPEFDWRRARATARTEGIAAANAGTLEGWRQSEVVTGKKWRCAGGPRSRATHKAADGQEVGVNEMFTVGGYTLEFPADYNNGAPPGETVNCRCTMQSVVDYAAAARQLGRDTHAEVLPTERGDGKIDVEEKGRENINPTSRNIIGEREASGLRSAGASQLSEKEISHIKNEIVAIEADIEKFAFDRLGNTAYLDDHDVVRVSRNVYPDTVSGSIHPRDLMSERAVLAHEYYGHRAFKDKPMPAGSWQDEFRASYFAAKNAPNLTDDDRRYLMLDAIERAKGNGVVIKPNKLMRRLIYGYDDET